MKSSRSHLDVSWYRDEFVRQSNKAEFIIDVYLLAAIINILVVHYIQILAVC